MASYPGAKVHRSNRRKLGRAQSVARPQASVTMGSAADTATLTFSVPVVVSGPVDLHVSGGVTKVSQTQTAPMTLVIVYSGALVGLTWSLDGAVAPIATYQGGQVANAAGTF